jgi:hypothetical protein
MHRDQENATPTAVSLPTDVEKILWACVYYPAWVLMITMLLKFGL